MEIDTFLHELFDVYVTFYKGIAAILQKSNVGE